MGEPVTNGRLRVSWSVAIQIVAWLVAVLLAYGAVDARVAVLESKQGLLERQIERIENKLDRVLERLR